MTLKTYILFLFSASAMLLSGCATQDSEPDQASLDAPGAPVRESSILAPVEEEEIVLVADAELVEEDIDLDPSAVSDMEQLTVASATPGSVLRLPDSPIDSPEIVIASSVPESVDVPSAAESVRLGEGAVAGAASAVLSVDRPVPTEISLTDEVKGESDVAAYLLDEAQNSYERGSYEKARGQAERALTLEPTAARAYLIMARIEINEGKLEQAAEMARMGLRSATDTTPVFEQLNQILAEVANIQSDAEGNEQTATIGEEPTPPEDASQDSLTPL